MCEARRGATTVCTLSRVGLVLAPTTLKKVLLTRSSMRPDRSIATMVFSKVGAA